MDVAIDVCRHLHQLYVTAKGKCCFFSFLSSSSLTFSLVGLLLLLGSATTVSQCHIVLFICISFPHMMDSVDQILFIKRRCLQLKVNFIFTCFANLLMN